MTVCSYSQEGFERASAQQKQDDSASRDGEFRVHGAITRNVVPELCPNAVSVIGSQGKVTSPKCAINLILLMAPRF